MYSTAYSKNLWSIKERKGKLVELETLEYLNSDEILMENFLVKLMLHGLLHSVTGSCVWHYIIPQVVGIYVWLCITWDTVN